MSTDFRRKRPSDERLRLLVESSEDFAMLTVTPDGRIDSWNPGAERILGYTEDEAIGEDMSLFFTPEDRAAGVPQREMQTALAVGRADDERYHLRKDGTRFFGSGVMTVLRDESGVVQGFAKILRDRTERRQAEEVLKASAVHAAFSAALSEALRPLTDPDAIQIEAAAVLGRHLGAARVFYGEVIDGDGDRDADRNADLLVAHNYVDGLPELIGTFPLEDFGAVLVASLRAGRNVVISDVGANPDLTTVERQLCESLGINALVAVPLVKEGRLVAAISVHQSKPHEWTHDEIGLIDETGDRTWAAIARAKAEAALRDRESRYRILFNSIGDAVLLGEVVTDPRGLVVDHRHVEVNPAYEALVGRSSEHVVGRTAREVLPGVPPSWFAAAGRAGIEGKTTRIEAHFPALEKWLDARFSPAGGPGNGRFVAIITDVSVRKRAEATLLEAAAHTAFRAELTDSLRPLRSPQDIKARATQVLGEHLGASRVHYAEIDAAGVYAIVEQHFANGVPDQSGRHLLADFPLLIEECRAGRRVVIPDIANDTRLSAAEKSALAALPVRAIVLVPLVKGGQFAAMLAVHHGAPHAWTVDEVALIEETAERTWSAVAQAEAEAARRESEERFRLLVEGARDYAMLLLDTAGRITFWSAGAARVFGWSEAEALGQGGAMLFTPEDRERGEPERELEMARREGQATDRRWHLRRDRSRFWADGLLMRLDDDFGELRGYAKVTRDATEQRWSEDAVRHSLEAVAQLNEDLEQRVAERTAELARMSEMRQELLRQLVSAQEEERGRISRDLHDDTGQQVTALLLGLSQLENLAVVARDAEAQAILTRLQDHAGEVAKKSHRLSFTLRPTALDDIGLLEALRNYTDEWTRWSGIPVDLQGVGMGAGDGGRCSARLPSEMETTIYRVTQEALTNVLRHAVLNNAAGNNDEPGREATRVSILVQRDPRNVVAIIEDDGPGFDVEAILTLPPAQRRLGIFGMQERARLAGGTLTVESDAAKGTTVYLRLPHPARA